MDKIKKLIKEALLNHKQDCGCGCKGKCAKAPRLNENLGAKVIMTENMQYHIDNKKPLTKNTFRYGSKAFLDLWAEARYLYSRDAINLSGEDKIIVETTHLGEYGLFEGEMVPLDLVIMEEETMEEGFQGDDDDGDGLSGFRGGKIPISPESEEDKIWRKNHEDILRLAGEGVRDWKRGIDVNYGPYKDQDSFEYMYWKKGWEEADLAAAKRKLKGLGENISGVDKDEIFALISKIMRQGKLSDDTQNMLMKWMNHPDASKEAIVKVLKQLTGTLDEAKEGKHVLNKPKRGGSKKFYVYVRNPKTKKIKKVSFGDTSGLSAKINNPEARRAFSKRHDCPNKKDRTKASYWSCALPRYAHLLGFKTTFTGYW